MNLFDDKEKDVETYLTRLCSNTGMLLTYKFTSPSNRGVPDRLVIAPGGRVYFVELKSSKGRLSPLQRISIQKLIDQGCEVRIINSKRGVLEFVEEVTRATTVSVEG